MKTYNRNIYINADTVNYFSLETLFRNSGDLTDMYRENLNRRFKEEDEWEEEVDWDEGWEEEE